MAIEEIVKGEVVETGDSSFYMIQRRLDELGNGPVSDYIQKYLPRFCHGGCSKHSAFKYLPEESILFFDVESCGLRYTDPIFMIGMLEMPRGTDSTDNITVKGLFARDYFEERAIISAFNQELHKFSSFVTFNGTTFDITRINERAKQNGIKLNGGAYKSLSDLIGLNHYDLYLLAKDRVKTRDGKLKLQIVEKVVFHTARVGDVSGKQIPQTYRDYVAGKPNDEKLARVIEHNFLDTMTMLGLLLYLYHNHQ